MLKRLGKLNEDDKEILVEDIMIRSKRRLWIEADGLTIRREVE